jgi:hypothetical protein
MCPTPAWREIIQRLATNFVRIGCFSLVDNPKLDPVLLDLKVQLHLVVMMVMVSVMNDIGQRFIDGKGDGLAPPPRKPQILGFHPSKQSRIYILWTEFVLFWLAR